MFKNLWSWFQRLKKAKWVSFIILIIFVFELKVENVESFSVVSADIRRQVPDIGIKFDSFFVSQDVNNKTATANGINFFIVFLFMVYSLWFCQSLSPAVETAGYIYLAFL